MTASPTGEAVRPLRVVIVTGIYPPDIGGPATHARHMGDELRSRGHVVTILSLCDHGRNERSFETIRFPRRWPWPLRMAAVAAWLVRQRRSYDIVYATGMQFEAVAASRVARRPVIVKVVGDPAWERSRRLGLVTMDFDEFQRRASRSWRLRAMCASRTFAVRRATAVVAPSAYLAQVVDEWIGTPGSVHVVPNGVLNRATAEFSDSADPGTLRALYVGRLVSHKNVDMLVEAVAAARGVRLEVVGDGPERGRLEELARRRNVSDRVRFCGPMDHDSVWRRLEEAQVLVTVASYEGLPHTVLEAFACSKPVVTSTAGGTTEAVLEGVNGLLVEPLTVAALTTALVRLRDDPALLASLSHGARNTAAGWSMEACAERLAGLLVSAAAPATTSPRAVFVGKTGIGSPPRPEIERRLGILSRHLNVTAVVVGSPGLRRAAGVRLVVFPRLRPPLLGGALYYALAPIVGALLAAGRRPGAVVCQSPYEGFGAVCSARLVPRALRPPVVVEVHGDWRTATRVYGGRGRRILAPLADSVAGWTVQRADRVRAVGLFTERLARDAGYRGPVDIFLAFSDYDVFLRPDPPPLPKRPQTAFVGVLEPSKAPEVLLDAWVMVHATCPDARLVLAGAGPMRRWIEHRVVHLGLSRSVALVGQLSPAGVADLLDESWCLALPSRSEGLPRIVIETMARARPVVAAEVGGIPEVVSPGRTGLLVPPGDPRALATALLLLLEDQSLAADLGRQARAAAEDLEPLRQFDEGIARLAVWISGQR